MNPQEIERRITGALPGAQIELRGADCHFEVLVVSDAFAEKTQLTRQRQLLALFGEELANGALHALSVRAFTPDELHKHTRLVSLEQP